MKVPIERFEDFDPDDPEIEFRKKRWDYWGALKKVREEYEPSQELAAFDIRDFAKFVESKYGIKMNLVNGRITDKYEIVDEKLYVYFLLKWA
jgi:hypothetical protein